ncbi:hypothetical protein M408DRAFT_22450 [Serendipita vermifera MAFF 305830]|uniref:Uncharacterized protein n=1 Tax=Serendipita vermifera MAFF 305830 TaxID=933852 RepID=A0A0C3AZT4_SERVB|nr:hypothetical protein M408DRAFT_22450 [Serendipita vermifera MAFF 305830]
MGVCIADGLPTWRTIFDSDNLRPLPWQGHNVRKRDTPRKPDNITVPVNYGAYTNGTFPPTNFTIPNTRPQQRASFYAFGGGSIALFTSYNNTATSTSVSSSRTITITASPINDLYSSRSSGGANRSTIYGSARWGSGDAATNVISPNFFTFTQYLDRVTRSYIYGFWPIYWGPVNYGQSGAYSFDPLRP